MGKSQRTKGAAFERLIVHCMKPFFPEAARNLLQTRDGGYDIKAGPYALECKHGKQPNIRAAMKQCREAVKGTKLIPVVVSRRDREEILATMDMDTFTDLVEAAYGMRSEAAPEDWLELDKDD